MSHTYGEVLERSYSNIFRYMDVEGATSAILDVGSGYGGILVAAVQQYDRLAYGIEKYRDKYEAAVSAWEQLPAAQRSRLRFMLADVNDVDLVSLLEGSLVGSASTGWESDSLTAGNMVDAPACEIASSETGHAAETADRAFDSLLLFCNNVAFNEGTIRRLGAKAKAVQERLGSLGVPVTVLSMMSLSHLEACRRRDTVALWTTWNDEEPHESYVYYPP